MTHKRSKLDKLLKLVEKYPHWTCAQYARETGQTPTAVKTMLRRQGYSTGPRGGHRVKTHDSEYSRPKLAKNIPKPVVNPQANKVFSKCTPRAYGFGYTKLM